MKGTPRTAGLPGSIKIQADQQERRHQQNSASDTKFPQNSQAANSADLQITDYLQRFLHMLDRIHLTVVHTRNATI